MARPVDIKRWKRDIAAHLEDLPRQLEALEFAYAGFDAGSFAEACESHDPATYIRVQAVERGFSRVQNHLAELARLGALLAELQVEAPTARQPRSQPYFEALHEAGAITRELCRRRIAGQKQRALLEHEYLSLDADTLFAEVQRILEDGRVFLRAYATWITAHLGRAPTAG